jgi:16S rRNA (cytosine1402-N4)-methyltransferase
MQIDNPERGFSYKADGPLDLRLNPEAGITAAQRLAEVGREELAGMLYENADEPYAEEIARQIISSRKKGKCPRTTKELYDEVAAALAKVDLPKEVFERTGYSSRKQDAARREMVKKSATRVFQALRIDINHEYEVLYEFMEKLPYALAPGGRAAILTFHSGEDRIVKKAFKAYKQQGLYSDVAADVIRPGREECRANPRAHSTKLRWAVRAAD